MSTTNGQMHARKQRESERKRERERERERENPKLEALFSRI